MPIFTWNLFILWYNQYSLFKSKDEEVVVELIINRELVVGGN
jgi:hypothetical protein